MEKIYILMHSNQTRIVLKTNDSIEEYEYEDKNNLILRTMFTLLQ